MIPTFSLNSTDAPTELCMLGSRCHTDKSPYNDAGHRHPYTPFYNMILSQYKNKPVRFAEIGIAGAASVSMWCTYFKQGSLFFFDRDMNFIENARRHAFPNARCEEMDVSDPKSIRLALEDIGSNLDVLLDDSSHDYCHQKFIIEEGLKHVRSGGMLLIEDIFRSFSNSAYMELIEPVKDQLAFFCFFEMEHKNKWSPGWDNDKILMLVKA
jgi:hypothetical protein